MQIKKQALSLGFSICGICSANSLESKKGQFQEWLSLGYAGEMSYLHNHSDLRFNPKLLVENTKSIIVVAHNYFNPEKQLSERYKIAKYAYGEDYHVVIKNKLNELLKYIKNNDQSAEGRAFVDSAPVLERDLAVRAGIGWIGKSTLLITPEFGSFIFLGTLFLNKDLDYDTPFSKNLCGNCIRCISRCPTHALIKPQLLDSRKCISYLTIEKRSPLLASEKKSIQGHLYGCDLCQDVCPWNQKKGKINTEPRYTPNPNIIRYSDSDWENLSAEDYKKTFKGSAVNRIKYLGIKRNLQDGSSTTQLPD